MTARRLLGTLAGPERGVAGLKQAGRWYAGTRALDDPEISPAFADLTDLPPAIVFIGHRDILLPDARRIEELGAAAGVRVELRETPVNPRRAG